VRSVAIAAVVAAAVELLAPWIDEIGDACAGRLSCVPLGADTYQLQSEYSNAAGSCATH